MRRKERERNNKGRKNDYSQHFVDCGERPQNFVRDNDHKDRFLEYPKLQELIYLKDDIIRRYCVPPHYFGCDLKTFDLFRNLESKFDVIIVDPPWEEYSRRDSFGTRNVEWWSFDEIASLDIPSIAENPSFLFLWCGSEDGLEKGRLLLKKWGFRRCEDICWLKTNKNSSPSTTSEWMNPNFLFRHTKEHCLMGIRGTVRRNQDGYLIHANVDTDIIISEECEYGSSAKPEELYHIIEHFSNGRRRIELFGTNHNIRPGWVTLGREIIGSNYSSHKYKSYFVGLNEQTLPNHIIPTTREIEELRPKSPPRPTQSHYLQEGEGNQEPEQPQWF